MPQSFISSRSYATSGPDSSTAEDPTLARSIELLEQGTLALEQGDLEGAKKFYKESVDVKTSSGGWFNLGVSASCLMHKANGSRKHCKKAELMTGMRVPPKCVLRLCPILRYDSRLELTFKVIRKKQ